MARTQNAELLNSLQAGFKYIENESFESAFQGLFSEIDLASPKLGRQYADRNSKLCTIIQKIAEGLNDFSADIDALGDAYQYLIGQNPAKKPLFDAIVANQPFSYRWESGGNKGDDVRFKSHGLAPKSAADFAVLLHGSSRP